MEACSFIFFLESFILRLLHYEKESSRINNIEIRRCDIMREKLYHFMQGRHGADQFNRFLMILAIICFAFSLFGLRIFYIFGIAIFIYAYFRVFSRNIYKRREENYTYIKYEYKLRQRFLTWKQDMQQRKIYHIYRCPSCKQKIRVPRGKGRIEIRCPKCSQTFIKKS